MGKDAGKRVPAASVGTKSGVKKGDVTGAVQFSEQLGEYFKFITRNTADTVPLAAEARHTRNYAEIQMTRFGERIHLEFGEVPPGTETLLVPRLILQPIIENVFEHGLKEKEEKGLLRVSFQEEAEFLLIEIEDNGDHLKDQEIENLNNALEGGVLEEITAIFNIHKRLKIFYGEHAGIVADRSGLGGLRICLRLEKGRPDEIVSHFGSGR